MVCRVAEEEDDPEIALESSFCTVKDCRVAEDEEDDEEGCTSGTSICSSPTMVCVREIVCERVRECVCESEKECV
jgi:hypothetical protein